jgi:HEAT repeat protein
MLRKAQRSSSLVRSLLLGAALSLGAATLGGTLTGCRDENDPMTYVGDLKDATKQPVAIKRIIQFYEDAMTRDKKDKNGPTVKPLLDQIVTPMNDICMDASLQPRLRATVVKFLSDVRDKRAIGCFKKTLEEYKPDQTEEDVQNVLRAVAAMKDDAKELAPSVMKVFTTAKFSKPKVKQIGKDLTNALLAVVSTAQEDELVKMLDAPIDLKVEENVHEQAFWQTVAARALGDMKSQKAIRPLIKTILSPSKGPVSNTALVALVKIGKAAVGPAEQLLKGEDKELVEYSTAEALKGADGDPGSKDKDGKIKKEIREAAEKAYVSNAAQILGALGADSSAAPLLGALEKADDSTKVIISMVLPLVPKSNETIEAFKATFDKSKMDLEVPGVGSAKELLADGSCDFFDAGLVPWLTDAAVNLKAGGGVEQPDVDSIRTYALLATMKVMKADQIANVEALANIKTKGTDDKGKEIDTTLGKSFEKEWKQAKELVTNCKDGVDCYMSKLVDDKSQEKDGQFTGIKAAYMIGILGNDATRAKLVEAMPKITNGAVRQAALKALQALAPKGDAAAAEKLLAMLEKAEEAKDEKLSSEYQVFIQVAARLRARAQ